MLLSEVLDRAGLTPDQIRAQVNACGGDYHFEKRMAEKRRVQGQERAEEIRGYTLDTVSKPAHAKFSIDYDPSSEFVADIISPVMPGDISRQYLKTSRRDASRIIDNAIASDGRLAESDLNISFATYAETNRGQVQRVDLNAVAQAPVGLDLLAKHERALMNDIARARERRVLTQIGTVGNYAASCSLTLSTATDKWDVGASTSTANPVDNILDSMASSALAKKPNLIVASTKVLNALRKHPKVVAAAGVQASARRVSYQELAALFEVQMIVEAKAKYDSAGNSATASYDYIAGKWCALLYIEPGIGKDQMSFTKTFRHVDITMDTEVTKREGVKGVLYMSGTHADAEVITASDAGFLIDACLT